jgi:hypothetical protein
MQVLKAMTEEISIASASNVNGSKLLRIYNTGTTDELITIANGGATIASFTVASKTFTYVEKETTDTIQGANVRACGIAYKG